MKKPKIKIKNLNSFIIDDVLRKVKKRKEGKLDFDDEDDEEEDND